MDRTKTTLYLNPGQLETLKRESARTGAPVAELIRRAIDAYYGQQENDGQQ